MSEWAAGHSIQIPNPRWPGPTEFTGGLRGGCVHPHAARVFRPHCLQRGLHRRAAEAMIFIFLLYYIEKLHWGPYNTALTWYIVLHLPKLQKHNILIITFLKPWCIGLFYFLPLTPFPFPFVLTLAKNFFSPHFFFFLKKKRAIKWNFFPIKIGRGKKRK